MFRNSERNRSRYGETIKTHEKKTFQIIGSNGDVRSDGSMGSCNPTKYSMETGGQYAVSGAGLFISIRLLSKPDVQEKQQGREE